MTLSSLETLRAVVQSIWINKAEYMDAEREYHQKMQKQIGNQTSKPEPTKFQSSTNKRPSVQDNQIDLNNTVGAACVDLEALKVLANQSQYRDAERLMEIEKQKENQAPTKMKYDLTPYQGKKRCFGKYACKPCHRIWSSGYSWGNMGQQCNSCMRMIYPHKQRQLKRRSGNNVDKLHSHDTQKCEKCRNIKGDCRDYVRNDSVRGFRRRIQC